MIREDMVKKFHTGCSAQNGRGCRPQSSVETIVALSLSRELADMAMRLKGQMRDEGKRGESRNFLVRAQLLVEELGEFFEALAAKPEAEALKEACDVQYVLSGAIVDMGWDDIFDEAFERVHISNMSKFVNGAPTRDDSGRVIKGPGYVPPKLEELL